ncbi:unnamed protein product [[Candida] boidinii]|nr:unnamed protein product [[Candida] boidinii]
MISEIIILDSNLNSTNDISNELKSSILNKFNSNDTIVLKAFNNFKSLINYLLIETNYTYLKNNHSNKEDEIKDHIYSSDEIEQVDSFDNKGNLTKINKYINNDLEYDIFYTIGIILNNSNDNSNNNTESLNDLSSILKKELIETRFHHLNPVVLNMDLSSNNNNSINYDDIISNQFITKLYLINDLIKTRILRIKTWVGLQDDKINNKDLNIHSMTNVYNNFINKNDINNKLLNFTKLLNNEINFENLLIIKNDKNYYLNLLNSWDFPAHNLTNDELLYCGYLILSQQFINARIKVNENGNGNEDEDCTCSTSDLSIIYSYLFHIRDNYRIGNPFHNFRHAIDVVQATYYFLLQLDKSSKDEFSIQLDESYRLHLLLSSLGHDLGHPGTTNLFLKDYETPISKIFNNESPLEKFHLLQYKNISDNYFKIYKNESLYKRFENFYTKLIKKVILATDMAQHDLFVNEIEKFKNYENEGEKIVMLCCLLIKCADISNVCRPLNISAKWGLSLGNEFKEISQLEKLIKTNEYDEDSIENNKITNHLIKNISPIEAIEKVNNLSNSQMFFINRFAFDFFNKISINIESMKFMIDQLNENTNYWKSNIK